ncbi:MAG: fructosamine kinase family protein [Longimicrobiales bacterium]
MGSSDDSVGAERTGRSYHRAWGGATASRTRSPTLPGDVRAAVERAWGEVLHREVSIETVQRVAGGCVSPSARLVSTAGDTAFLKWGEGDVALRMFAAEAGSLSALAEVEAVRVPAVLAAATDEATVGWLILEWLEPGQPTRGGWRSLGHALARLHRTRAERFGWQADNFIGSLPQPNAWTADWAEFWRSRRLEPQLQRACDRGLLDRGDRRRFDRLFDVLDSRLAVARDEGASLLHGDLWSGNVHMLKGGTAALVDPASYYGHREVDVAMTELFGGFDPAFFEAYDADWPLDTGYREGRRAIYQLYYLLVHVNLFGSGYVASTLAALERAGC